jgi:hypothetical protein
MNAATAKIMEVAFGEMKFAKFQKILACLDVARMLE